MDKLQLYIRFLLYYDLEWDCLILFRTNWILGSKKHPSNKFTHSEIVEALVLRKKIGSNNYQHIRKKQLSCLPSLSCLRKRIAGFHVNPGMLHSSLGLVRKHLENETREEKRLVVISYDEVAVDRDISFDQRSETPLKSSCKLQVAMVRGLFRNFKVPIFADFNRDTVQSKFSVYSHSTRW